MGDIVAKAFKTVNRRFAVGDPVCENEIERPLNYSDLRRRKFIVGEESKLAARLIESAQPEPALPE